jgi:hypothetical protein
MGVDIRIGQARFGQTDPECAPEWYVEEISLSDAPAHEYPGLDRKNKWEMSYTAQSLFVDYFDLPSEFNVPRGYIVLRSEHLTLFQQIDRRCQHEFPQSEMTLTSPHFRAWILWWIEWALKNCPNPIMTFR